MATGIVTTAAIAARLWAGMDVRMGVQTRIYGLRLGNYSMETAVVPMKGIRVGLMAGLGRV